MIYSRLRRFRYDPKTRVMEEAAGSSYIALPPVPPPPAPKIPKAKPVRAINPFMLP